MTLIFKIFVVAALIAVHNSSPVYPQAESTTAGIRPLPASLSKTDNVKSLDSDKDDTQRDSRQSAITPARNSYTYTTSKYESRRISRNTDDQKVPPPPPPPAFGAPPPPPPCDPAKNSPQSSSGSESRNTRDTDDSKPKIRPATHPVDIKDQPQHKNGPTGRPVRDVSTPPTKQTRPAPIPSRDTKPAPGGRTARDVSSPVASAGSTTSTTDRNSGSSSTSTSSYSSYNKS